MSGSAVATSSARSASRSGVPDQPGRLNRRARAGGRRGFGRSPKADALIERVAAEGAEVPDRWFLEVANGLVMAERRGRLKAAESAAFIALLEALPITPDRATGARALHETLGLARAHGLTAKDAAYLELAMRQGLPLATGDRRLAAAAAGAGVVAVHAST